MLANVTVAQVALDVPQPEVLDYLAPTCMVGDIGRCVVVPFGTRQKIGVIVGVKNQSEIPIAKLREIKRVLYEWPPLPAHLLALCSFCAQYYQYPLGQIYANALPALLRRGAFPQPLTKRKALLTGKMTVTAKFLSTPGNDAHMQDVACMPEAVSFPKLTTEQELAVQKISGRGFKIVLLHGITGSGKTEVYLQAMAEVHKHGGQSLLLVPEIALTPQLEHSVLSRFPSEEVVSAHSGMGEAARARSYLAAMEGRANIVLGTRLAVFMPMPNLQLIIVDEEQDASFKQQDRLRYSARDLAIWRAREQDVPIMLGSATPSLETFYHANTGRYQKVQLKQRALALALPKVTLINTRQEKLNDGISLSLIEEISQCLKRKEQSLIFLNRRGYAPVLACTACGWSSQCPRCSAYRVFHAIDRRMRCHYCGQETDIPKLCPECGNQDLLPFGRGTQRLEGTLQQCFPQARVVRADRDSAGTPRKWRALHAKITAGEVDILLGTQLLAKGHDFPMLSLVGVLGADAALFAADFRAPERMFAQLMQVGGRSGRAERPGKVLIQTQYPDHPLYQFLIEHDYDGFAKKLLAEREAAGFPPFTHHCVLRAEAPAMKQALDFLQQAQELALALADENMTIFDPVPMRMQRVMQWERGQLLVESMKRSALQNFLKSWRAGLLALKLRGKLRWHLERDPLEL